jgi:hypothetical protein
MPPLSILDLAFVPEGGRVTKGRMKKAELRRSCRRFWLAEHQRKVGIKN